MMLQKAIVTPIATETGASVPSGISDDENEARSSNTFWKNRRSHNPGSVPIPLLDATAARRKGHRRHRPSKQHSSNTSVEASLASPRILVAMLLLMVVCVVLQLILVDCFFFGNGNHILGASNGGTRKKLSSHIRDHGPDRPSGY
jgi:hypothetical protein